MPRRHPGKKPKLFTDSRKGYDDKDLAEVVTWVERADHDQSYLKREQEAAREAEKEKDSWD